MAELADALDLGSSGATRSGSSPVIRTLKGYMIYHIAFFLAFKY